MRDAEFTFTIQTPDFLRDWMAENITGWTGQLDVSKPLSNVAEEIEYEMIQE